MFHAFIGSHVLSVTCSRPVCDVTRLPQLAGPARSWLTDLLDLIRHDLLFVKLANAGAPEPHEREPYRLFGPAAN
jgi:hypothetical protein